MLLRLHMLCLCSLCYSPARAEIFLPEVPPLVLPEERVVPEAAEGDCPDTVLYIAPRERPPRWMYDTTTGQWRCAGFGLSPARLRWLTEGSEREATYRAMLTALYEARVADRSVFARHVTGEAARADAWQSMWEHRVAQDAAEARRAWWRGALTGVGIGAAVGLAVVVVAE